MALANTGGEILIMTACVDHLVFALPEPVAI